jgi:hypothetical protein
VGPSDQGCRPVRGLTGEPAGPKATREGGLFHVGGRTARLLLVDSITEAVGSGAGCVVVSGSHGGTSAGHFARQARPALVVFNDAGVGKDSAGIAALPVLQAAGIAACTVAHTSARIGEAASTLEDGVISQANPAAGALGGAPGRPLRQWLDSLCTDGATTREGAA